MILLYLTGCFLVSLSGVVGHGSNLITDYETSAIIEATHMVDGYYSWMATHGKTQTIAGTIMKGKRPDHSLSLMYLFTRYAARPEIPDQLGRSARIANLATYLLAIRGGKPDFKSFQAKMAPVCAVPRIKCDPTLCYRTIDGSCNNLDFPLWGKSLTSQARFIPPSYDDKFNLGLQPRTYSKIGGYLPNPRDISNILNRKGTSLPGSQRTDLPRSKLFNVALTTFGQFVSHDVSSIPAIRGHPDIECCHGDKPVKREECFSFSTPPGDFQTTCMSFVRTQFAPNKYCAPGTRNQLNQATSYLDLSVNYGTTTEMAAELTDRKTGKLISGPCELLPDGPSVDCMGKHGCLRSGDTRHSVVPSLTTFHVLFHREHNRIVDILCGLNPHWKGDRLFQEARKILIGIYQHIVYNEYLPIIIGKVVMKWLGILPTPKGFNTRYDKHVDASVRNSFAVAPFRFGHAQILHDIGSASKDRSLRTKVPMVPEFFKTRLVHDKHVFGIDGISRWITTEFNYLSGRYLADSVRNQLFETKPGNGFDLGALDIQRGRDHGIPSYNEFRRFCGLKPAIIFKGGPFGLPDHDPKAAEILSLTYKHPEDIDLMTGGMSEIHTPGGIVGPTFSCLISLQFKYLKIGDRFNYENAFPKTGFTPVQINIIKHQTLSSLFCRNVKMGVMQPNAFVSAFAGQPVIPCGKLPQLGPHELSAWKELPQKY